MRVGSKNSKRSFIHKLFLPYCLVRTGIGGVVAPSPETVSRKKCVVLFYGEIYDYLILRKLSKQLTHLSVIELLTTNSTVCQGKAHLMYIVHYLECVCLK